MVAAVVRSFTSMRAGIVCAGCSRVGAGGGGGLKGERAVPFIPRLVEGKWGEQRGDDWIWRELVKDLFLSFFFTPFSS